MRSASDVAAAQDAGADAVGFVTAPRSVRFISPSMAAEIGAGCSISRFLVTEDETPDDLLAAALLAEVTGVQPHGAHADQAARAALQAGYDVLYPVVVAPGSDVETPEGMIPILDGPVPGSGIGFDSAVLGSLPAQFVVAGGLTPDNVGEVLTRLRPYGVDVSSGIERERGVKDPELMKRFVEAVR
jgi:phosphoribosylanthranilate isomerase